MIQPPPTEEEMKEALIFCAEMVMAQRDDDDEKMLEAVIKFYRKPRYLMANRLMQFFSHNHLPPDLKKISKACCDLAEEMDKTLPETAEKTAGLRKLLEAKDCFVRAVIEKPTT